MSFKKINSSGHLQNYIPPGNGEISGEYTNESNMYLISEKCTKDYLIKFLTKDEIKFISLYTNYLTGAALNKAIRNNTLTQYGILMRDNIISAIKKHKLKNDVHVFRGIHVSKEIFENMFYKSYINNEKVNGSIICSTSRNLQRAIKASISKTENDVALVFQTILPKGYNALPIEDLSSNKSEQEILISKPQYLIKKIDDIEVDFINFRLITIEIIKE